MGLLLAAFPAGASLIAEVEPNSTFATAQIVPNSDFSLDLDPNIVNSTTIPHVTIVETGDAAASVDFFSFTTVGGVIVLDIDSAPQNTNFDTEIHLFDTAGNPLATSDDNDGDPGDGPGIIGGAFNSKITTGVLPAGNYVAAVSTFVSDASAGGNVTNTVPQGGTYTLHISTQVPGPATLILLGAGLLGLGAAAWRRRR